MEDPTPFFVGGGATHSPEVVRQGIYDYTGGAEGVSSPTGLKVSALAQAGTRVRVAPGGGLLNNRYPGGSGQSYTARNASETEVDIVATGSGGPRTDMVVLRILDPQYEGQPPADPKTFKYTRLAVVQGVPPTARTAAELNLGYPAIALSRVAMPISTATVQEGYITDLRQLARPQTHREVDTFYPSAATRIDTTGYKDLAKIQGIEVPRWATHVNIIANFSGLALLDGNTSGSLRASFTGWAATYPTKFDENQTSAVGSGRYGRSSYIVARKMDIPEIYRGTVRELTFQGLRDAGGGTGFLQSDTGSTLTYDIEFTQAVS